MVSGLATGAALILALGVGGPWEARITAHYGPTAFDEVLRNRQEWYEAGKGPFIPHASCYIAHPTIPLGESVQVWGLNTGKVLRCIVGDTSAPVDRARHIRTRLIEIDWANTVTICGSRTLRNDECPTLVREVK